MDQPVLIDESGREYIAYQYSLTAKVPTLAPGAQVFRNPRIDNSSEFVWTKISGSARVAGGSGPIDIDVEFKDGGSDRPLQLEPVSWDSLVGTAQLPYILSIPLIIVPTASLSVVLQNTSATLTYEQICLTLSGYRRVYQ